MSGAPGPPRKYTHAAPSLIILPFLAELNAAPARPPRSRIRFLPAASAGPPALEAVRVPVLAEHRLGECRERRRGGGGSAWGGPAASRADRRLFPQFEGPASRS